MKLAHLPHEKANTLLLLATCLIVLVPHLFYLPWWLVSVCMTVLAWRGWITYEGRQMPPRPVLVGITAAAIVVLYWNYRTLLGREVGVAMLVLLLTLKLLEMRARRDLFVVLFLCSFLVLAHYFHSQSIVTALFTLFAAAAIVTTQLSFQYTGQLPPLRQRLALAARILLLGAPLTLLLFLLFPRIQGPLWGLPNDAHARTGLSATMAPGNIAQLARSDQIAFRVKFDSPVPKHSELYWRGIVLSQFDGRTWSALPQHRVSMPPLIHFDGEPLRYQVTMEPHGQHWLFALEAPALLPALPDNAARVTPELQLVTTQPVNERVRYDMASHTRFAFQSEVPARTLRAWTALPSGFNPRTLAHAAHLRRQAGSDEELVNTVLAMFNRQDFRYTLEPPLLSEHTVDEFLFDTRAGFCEHYAGAFVVLMRAAGIPARVVTGYLGGEINPNDGYLTVRQSDAHAWAEVWLPQRGWVRVDPTAAVSAERIERNLAHAIPQSAFGGLIRLDPGNLWTAQWIKWRQRWEALDNAWNQWVLNYTPERQRQFISSLGIGNVNWRKLALLSIAAGLAAGLLMFLPLVLLQRKRDPFVALYEKLCAHMARQGWPRAPHEGPRAYAERLSAAPFAPEKKAALAQFLELYETVRYGATALPRSATLSRLKSLLTECR